MALRLSKPASGIIKGKPSKQLCVSADIRIPAPSDLVSNYKRQDTVELEGARVMTVKWALWELHGLINKPLWLCALVCLFVFRTQINFTVAVDFTASNGKMSCSG